MGGFWVGVMAGACAVGLETLIWLSDHIRQRNEIRAIEAKNRELGRSVVRLSEDRRELIEANGRIREANAALRREVDRLRREVQAKGEEQ